MSVENDIQRCADYAAKRRDAIAGARSLMPLLCEGLAIKGRAFDSTTPFTADEQKLLRRIKAGHRRKAKHCFANSQRVFSRYHEFEYAEGYTTSLILHAWLLLNGKVVDVTLDRATCDYFGVVIPRELVLEYNIKSGVHGPLIDDWETDYEFQQRVLGSRYSA